MSGGGVENNWRLGGGMDILFYLFIFLIIRFFLGVFFCLFLLLFFLPRILVMVRYNLR